MEPIHTRQRKIMIAKWRMPANQADGLSSHSEAIDTSKLSSSLMRDVRQLLGHNKNQAITKNAS